MSELASFEDFYSAKIDPLQEEYKSRSRAYDTWGYILFSALLLFFISLIIYFQADLEGTGFFCFISFGLAIAATYKFAVAQGEFVGGFKQRVIKEIVDFIIPENEYKPDSYISSNLFKASCLYRTRIENIEGDDFIRGKYKNLAFQASELWTYTRRAEVTNEGMLFKGLFFAADIGRFTGGTYIWKNDNVQLGDSIADERYRLYPIPKVFKINSGSPQFDKHYKVYSTYPAEAHSILTQEMMQNILSFKHQLKREISLSFVAGRCYVAIPFNETLLEPANDLTDKETIKEYFFTILLYPAIINQLKLYEYI